MALTVTNTNVLSLLNIVNKTNAAQSNTLTQLSTGSKLNSGKDNPAGLVAYSQLGAELTAVNGALDNNARADSMLSVADGAMGEISSLLSEIETLTIASASDGGLSEGEISANQAQIDAALESIDRIVNTTNFNGKLLLNGAQAINSTGVDTTAVENLKIYTRSQSTSDTSISVTVDTAAAAASAVMFTGFTGTLSSDVEIEVTGNLGSKTLTLTSGMDEADVAAAIDAAQTETGVVSDTSSANLVLKSANAGSDEFVQVAVLSGTGGITGSGSFSGAIDRTEGVDAEVTINGAQITADGETVSYSAAGLSLSFDLGGNLDTAGDTETFTVKADGGLTFQLGTTAQTRSTIGISSMSTSHLGGGAAGGLLSQVKSGGSFDLSSGQAETLSIVRKAMNDVAVAQGRVGGFQKFQVQTSINALNASAEGLTSARSVIGDTDYAVASAELNKQNVLLQSGISLLGLANQQSGQLLALLG